MLARGTVLILGLAETILLVSSNDILLNQETYGQKAQ